MAAIVLTTAMVQTSLTWTGTAPGAPGTQTISGTLASPSDISGYVRSVATNLAAESQDATTFGSGGFKINLAGLKDGSIALGLIQDLAASAFHSIWNTYGLGATVLFDIKATNAVRSATNPSLVCAVINTGYTPISGQVGNVNSFDLTLPTTGAFAFLTS